MTIANARGKAAKSPRPPSTSHVSLPSQIGATEAITRSRASSPGANGKRIPTPRSKPSSSTYMKTAKARISVHTGTRSRLMAGSALAILLDRRGHRACRALDEPRLARLNGRRQPAFNGTHEVVDAGAEDDEINGDVEEQRSQHIAARNRWGDRVRGAQEPVHDERLAADLGGHPARGHRDVADRNRPGCGAQVCGRCEETLVPGEPPRPNRQRQHDRPPPDHDAETKERRRNWWSIRLREVLESFHRAIETVSEIEARELRNGNLISVRLGFLVGQREQPRGLPGGGFPQGFT